MTKIAQVDSKLAKRWLEEEEAVIVDVREPAEYNSEKVEGSHSVPLNSVDLATLESLPCQNKKVILLCSSGRRSAAGCEKLIDAGVDSEVFSLKGGIQDWKQQHLPVVRSGRYILPLDRQVQLTIGLMIVIGLSIGYFIHSAGLLLTLLAGLGLINAALTGWCGLALAMAKMPWNRG